MWTGLFFILAVWLAQTSSTSSSAPESGLEKAAAASAVIAGSDAAAGNGGQQQTDLETRLKRITDTLHRVKGPDVEPSDAHKSERLVVADRPPSYQGGASQSPFMMRNDEFGSSGDGALGDDDEGDDNGEFGSGDVMFGPDSGVIEPSYPRGGSHPSPVTEGVYPMDVDEYTTRKSAATPSTKRPPAWRSGTGDKHVKTHVESESRDPKVTSKPRASGSFSYRTLSYASLWLRLLASISLSLLVYQRTFGDRRW